MLQYKFQCSHYTIANTSFLTTIQLFTDMSYYDEVEGAAGNV